MKPTVIPLPGNAAIAHSLAEILDANVGACEIRRFPDGESYVRLDTAVEAHHVILVCSLDRPDEKFLSLTFAAKTARDLGATSIGLVCPYLAYMRQDACFHPGEAISAKYFGAALGQYIDWLVTVDPHLHRLNSLNDIFAIPTTAVHAAPLMSEWIRAHVRNPILIGPDSESEQWVASVAAGAGAPYAVLQKSRRGDRDVSISTLGAKVDVERVPVLVDDIISTAGTMIEAIHHLRDVCSKPPICVGVHAVFAENAYAALRAAGASQVVTCNAIAHDSNAIDLSSPIADAVGKFLSQMS